VQRRLFVALELSKRTWTLGLSPALGVAPWLVTIPSGDWAAVDRVMAQARERFRVPATEGVESCYEAGRDGFWVHRMLTRRGIVNHVVDSSSIEVPRRGRRAKTDRIDARKLVILLQRAAAGDRDAWHEVHVPSAAEEAARHRSRERTALTQERTRLINQMRGWLTTYGQRLPRRQGAWWEALTDASGVALPCEVRDRLARAAARLTLVEEQLASLAAAQQAHVVEAAPESAVQRLTRLKGIATTAATTLVGEGLVWRQFRNRREVGALLGLAPLPHASGELTRTQRTRHLGHRRLKSLAIQMAWNWIRWQPGSALTQWYLARFGTGARARRVGIVAVARKLVIALWHYVTTGVVPTGAVLSAA
jgi:transposase